MKYNHMLDIAFTLVSEDVNGADITPEMARSALLKRIADLDAQGWDEVWSICDTYEIEDNQADATA